MAALRPYRSQVRLEAQVAIFATARHGLTLSLSTSKFHLSDDLLQDQVKPPPTPANREFYLIFRTAPALIGSASWDLTVQQHEN